MDLQTAWLALLGLLLGGYFVLGGYDLGVQMLLPAMGHDDTARGPALSAMGPFFLGNEVWLVAFTGVLFGAFPHLEGSLLSGLYPLIVAILVGLVTGNAAVQLRGRARTAAGRRRWDALVVLGGALPALCWGLIVGLLLRGLPRRPDGSFHVGTGDVLHPFVLSCGVAMALLLAAHGAAFLALRSAAPEAAARAAHTGRTLLRATAAIAVLPLLLTLFGAGAAPHNPVSAAVLTAVPAAALAAAWRSLSRGRTGAAFTATCCAALTPVPLLGFAHYPYVLASRSGAGLTVGQAAADDATLTVLSAFGVLVIPAILAYQAWSWWVFRGRTGQRHPTYF
ncbi:cytochrome d ubiquinol oxidase subunit II [Streptomyces sp. TRM68367]|uniref:cytochrome d ubiquinol oxidase subunit II n=1 Tax=Streptomyces sp. TRM68367 TaxID=2758415 RepID=UPI00165BA131|nr:cytochrome d ubiquinol oxidase subunit II [Streptomyces sp. TRM68367]MBC9724082.1 cytochrome d ubiquinol oxidase subunit II [Streptomyces sp. TRM68367]